jgi:hypothetical protein
MTRAAGTTKGTGRARGAPSAPHGLGARDAADLNARADQALARQRRELAASIDTALSYIPLPLRFGVRKVLGL